MDAVFYAMYGCFGIVAASVVVYIGVVCIHVCLMHLSHTAYIQAVYERHLRHIERRLQATAMIRGASIEYLMFACGTGVKFGTVEAPPPTGSCPNPARVFRSVVPTTARGCVGLWWMSLFSSLPEWRTCAPLTAHEAARLLRVQHIRRRAARRWHLCPRWVRRSFRKGFRYVAQFLRYI